VLVLSLAAFLAHLQAASAQLSSPSSLPQLGNPSSYSNASKLINPPASTQKGPQAPPAALPGAASREDLVAPRQGGPIANPTDALFDAINRGDIASARDAIDRGADLSGHDVLGLTPLDLSVDLGRNDITFLLLSLRNGEVQPNTSRKAQQTATGGKPEKVAKAEKPAHAKVSPVVHRPPPQVAQTPAAPQFFAGNGGTPDPAAGFLGFSGH